MELIEFAERQGHEAAKFSLASLELARARCHQVLVLVLGGAGALAGVAISQWSTNRSATYLAAVVALWWFSIAAWLALRGLRSSPVRSWTYPGATVLDMEPEWTAYVQTVAQEGGAALNVVDEIRRSALRSAAVSADEYRTASTYAAKALDWAFVFCAMTPLPIVVTVGLIYRFG